MRLAVLFVLLAAVLPARAEDAPDAQALIGTWSVDLRPTPGAAPYFQTLTITGVDGTALEGTFYGTPFTEGRVNTDWDTVYFAFVTEDGSGPYAHSGRLEGGVLKGLSLSTGRDFLSVWTAARAED